ncbi:hypothetical protein ACSQ67_024472 [Phaseolus vulgaris]
MKTLRELGDANTYPRRSVRLSEKTSRKKNVMLNGEGMFSASISTGIYFYVMLEYTIRKVGRSRIIYGLLENGLG